MKNNKDKSENNERKSLMSWRRRGLTLPGLAMATLPLVIAANVHAFELEFAEGSELSGNLDMTLGYAASWRAEDADRSDLVSGFGSRGLNYTAEARDPDAGDLITNLGRATAELDLNWRNYGLVTSANYQYDREVMKSGNAVDIFTEQPINSSRAAKDYAGSNLDVLDAYVYGSFDVAENPLEVRVGKQVINWGEGLFFIGGVATQVPLNFNKLTTPGAELKEAYIGNEAVYAQMGIGDDSSLEAYYQWKWHRTELPPLDTFYGSEGLGRGGEEITSAGIPIRSADDQADDGGQWGAAFRTAVGDTELGVYYSRYHETLPLLAVDMNDPFNCDIGDGNGPVSPCNTVFGVGQIWAEDQDMFGLSASSTIGSWSVSGEIAYRPDQALWGDMFGKGYTNLTSGKDFMTNIERHDTVHAAVNGIWLGGPLDFIGVDSQVVLAQVGMDHISGNLDNLAVNSAITRTVDFATFTPDAQSYGAAVEWIGTWQGIRPGTDLSLDLFVQRDFKGNSHFWGNFAEGRTLFAATLTANVGTDWEASLGYSGSNFNRSDYEDQDIIGLSVNYKF